VYFSGVDLQMNRRFHLISRDEEFSNHLISFQFTCYFRLSSFLIAEVNPTCLLTMLLQIKKYGLEICVNLFSNQNTHSTSVVLSYKKQSSSAT